MARADLGKLTSHEIGQPWGSSHPEQRRRVSRCLGPAFWWPVLGMLPIAWLMPIGTAAPCLGMAMLTLLAARFGAARASPAADAAAKLARDNEARYRLLADNSTDVISLESSFAGSRSYVSPSVQAMTGHAAEAFLVLPASDYIHPEDQAVAAAIFEALSPERPGGKSLHRVRHKAGHWLWMDTDFRLIAANGENRTVLVRSRDVSVRHEAELALAASEARYRALAESTSDVITQLDLDFRRQYVSPSCRRVLGYEPEEMLDVRPSTRMHPDDAVEARALATRLISGQIEGDQAISTYRSLHKQGHWVWLETLLTLVRDADGTPTSLICSLRDVTERQRVARHLERAKIEAEAAAEAKAEFVANMSHELRTPLTGIIGVHDLLRSDPSLTDVQRRMIDLASEAGRSLLAIVNDVLDFSKVDAGQLVLERVTFDIDRLLADCRDLTRGQIGGKAVAVSLLRDPAELGFFMGDPTRVRQILLNLLTNAAKFTERGDIVVEARLHETGLLRVSVADTRLRSHVGTPWRADQGCAGQPEGYGRHRVRPRRPVSQRSRPRPKARLRQGPHVRPSVRPRR